MTGNDQSTTVGQLPTPSNVQPQLPATLTRLAWMLCLLSSIVLLATLLSGQTWELTGLVVVDGLTAVMWVAVTFFSGIVHSYSRRYMNGNHTVNRFFARVFAFTLTVMVLVAADNILLFGVAYVAMGLVMATLIGHVEGWQQAQTAGALARRYFLASSGFLALALLTLWYHTGNVTVSGIASGVDTTASVVVLFAAGGLVVAAMIQSALVPFHTWLLSSMTAPTPASALMHAGFVNAGGIVLVRFAPVITVDPAVMVAITAIGAVSALLGKLLKTVQTDVKGALGCSTTGQMGFMIMQAGLGFFGAAITHLVLHGFYKAYQFLSAGERVTQKNPTAATATTSTGPVALAVIAATGLAGGVVFAALTGKGTSLDTGLLLAGLVVLTVLHSAREIVTQSSLPTGIRFGAVPLIALPAIAIYAGVYRLIEGLLVGLPAVGQPAELTAIHGILAGAFLLAYLAVESGVYKQSHRLYVALVNASQPSSETLLTSTEEYNEY